jgi:hypothetical protein
MKLAFGLEKTWAFAQAEIRSPTGEIAGLRHQRLVRAAYDELSGGQKHF